MAERPNLDAGIFTYIWRFTARQQLWLFGVLVFSLPLYYLTLDLPKRIVNGPITGSWTPNEVQTILAFDLPLPESLGGSVRVFDGLTLDRVGVLVALCSLFLSFVILNGLVKFYLNNYKGRLGERLLRRLRYDLVDHVLRFPSNHFKQVRGPEIASMIKDETEPIGGFGGVAFADPSLLLTQAATALLFITLQNYWLGGVAFAVVTVQLILIPRMRRRLVVLARQRQLTARILSGRVGEVVEGIPTIRTNDTSNYERAELGDRLGKILTIRYDYYVWKFFSNFVNNLLSQMTPFIFYLAGGYFVITGRLDIGQLVAVIAAYKDLPAPLKELITWDQVRVDVQAKYSQIREQFVISDLIDPSTQTVTYDTPARIKDGISFSNLKIQDETGIDLLKPTSFRLRPGESVAFLGPVGSGGEHAAEALVRLTQPSGGRIVVDGQNLDALRDSFTGRRIGYAAGGMFLPQGSIRDALTYVLKHVPTVTNRARTKEDIERIEEARRAGNIDLDIRDDWIDYEAAGISGPDDLTRRLSLVLSIAGMRADVLRFGLRSRVPSDASDFISERLLEARRRFRKKLEARGDEGYFETFDRERYSDYASVLENLVFGIPFVDVKSEEVDRDHAVGELLDPKLRDRLIAMGLQIADTLLEIFGELSSDSPLLDSIDLMAAEDVEPFRAAVRRASRGNLKPKDQSAFLRLAFGYVEPRHRLSLLDDDLKDAILAGRRQLLSDEANASRARVAIHDAGEINPAASVQDNILFGRIVTGYAEAAERIDEVVRETLREIELVEDVFDMGLAFDIGSGAKRLSSGQQQKLVLARALLKRPDLLVLNRPLPALDADAQRETIERVLASRDDLDTPRQTIVWVVSIPDHATIFDRSLVFAGGELVREESHSDANGDAASEPTMQSERV